MILDLAERKPHLLFKKDERDMRGALERDLLAERN